MEMCMEAVMVHQESEASRGLQCGICLETPYEAGIKFGILPNCVHVFCLDCIRSWRTNTDAFGSDAVRVCPVCRVESYFVVPCERFVDNSDPARKQKVLDGYKESLSRIPCANWPSPLPNLCICIGPASDRLAVLRDAHPHDACCVCRCRYFKFGEGTCPFSVGGTLSGSGGCMYAHTARDGKPIDGDRLYMGQDGELQRVKTYVVHSVNDRPCSSSLCVLCRTRACRYDLCDFIAPKPKQGSRKKKK